MLEAFPAQIPKISVKTFPCLFCSPARTDLRIGLFPSGVSSKRLFAEVDFGGVALQ